MIVQRSLMRVVREALVTTPIVIVEGMRAVGKTHLMTALLDEGTLRYRASLTNPTTRDAARNYPLEWLRTLPQPFAIDEAQLAPELPLALKAFLDETNEQLRCVLTGSAAIGRQGFGGADPLARRAKRVTLEPLAESEIRGEHLDLITCLFNAEPIPALVSVEGPWAQAIPRGGLPRHRLHLTPSLSGQIDSDLDAVLTRDVLPGASFDHHIARRVVDHVLRHPAQELKPASIASVLEIDARTVNRYLDIAEDRFILTELPNLVRSAKRTSRTGAKAYPADTALSASHLISGVGGADLNDQMRGGLFEAHVAQQLRAHMGWSELPVNLSHWRTYRSGRAIEVDLILQNMTGRIVGIEVKSGTVPRDSDLNGLRALREAYPEHFHRGYVISGSDVVTPAGESMWRIPLSALQTPDFWTASLSVKNLPTPVVKENLTSMNDAQLFMSYTHADQASATGGDLRKFADDVVDAMEGLYGRTVSVFRDTRDGQWGENLWGRLEEELETATFLLPFITPRYLKSEGCRREFMAFDEGAKSRGTAQRILPLIWINPPGLDAGETADPVIQRLRSYRREDATGARTASEASYAQIVERVAERLEALMLAREQEVVAEVETSTAEGAAERSLDEILDSVSVKQPRIQRLSEDFAQHILRFAQELSSMSSVSNVEPGGMQRAMRTAAQGMKEPADRLTVSAQALTSAWAEMTVDLTDLARIGRELGEDIPHEVLAELTEFVKSLNLDELQDGESTVVLLTRMSSAFAPAARALRDALATARTIKESGERFLLEYGR